jgi:hypothetical protein
VVRQTYLGKALAPRGNESHNSVTGLPAPPSPKAAWEDRRPLRLQYRDEHHGDRLAEVQQLGGPGENRAGIAGVGVEVPGGAARVAGQQRPAWASTIGSLST